MRRTGANLGLFIAAVILASAVIAATTVTVVAQGAVQRFFDRVNAPAAPAGETAIAPAAPVQPARAGGAAGKDEDALKLLVVGDFMASGLARGLETTYAAEPRLVVVDRTNGSSGLVRADFYDWIAELPGILAEVSPDFVVLMIGTNDRQEMRTAAGTERLRSTGWDAEYAVRAAAIAAILEDHGKPALWVGQPPMRQRSMSTDMAFVNSVHQAAIEGVDGIYVDVWDAFADVEGRFAATGPDIEGQTRTLRGDDGFSLTTAGRVKLAYYIDREIRLPGPGDAIVFLADPEPGNRPEVLPDCTRQLVGPVIAFAQPPPGAPTELLDRPPVVVSSTAQYRLLVRGESLLPVTGRADDFRWPRPEPAIPAAAIDPPTSAAAPAAPPAP
jgi:hypothetical protein